VKALLALLVLLPALAASSATLAQQADQAREKDPMSMDNAGIVGEACFGDRYESNQDMNEGNTISDEEILRILNPPRS
jgi:hypothetical protein